MRAGRHYILCVIVFIFNSLHAQDFLAPEVLSVENGLSSRNVNTVLIDHKGFLWAGTANGLNRYDGYRFRHFFTSSAGSGYPGSYITRKVRTDYQGNIWVLNAGGINRIDHKTGEISRIPATGFDEEFKPGYVLTDIFPAESGDIWVLSDRSLTRINLEAVFNTWPIPSEIIRGARPTSLVADKRGNIWVGTTGGLLLFSVQQKTFKEIVGTGSPGLLSNNEVRCLYIDDKNSLWVGTANGLNYVDPVDYLFYQYFPVSARISAPGNRISEITHAGEENLLLATDAGVTVFDPTSLRFASIYATSDTVVKSVTMDLSGNIWAGTEYGVLKIRKSRLPVTNFHSRSRAFSLTYDHVTALLSHTSGNKLFIGYYKNGYSVIDTRNFTGGYLNTLDNSPVVGFYPFRQQEYLIASGHDIEVFTPAARRTSIFSIYPFMKRQLLENTSINCLFFDGRFGLWIGTSDGIQCVRIDSARHYPLSTLKYQGLQMTIGEVHDIHNDASGNLWLGTENGLIVYNPSRGNFNRLTPYDVNLMNTEHKAVYTIVPERSGVFWLGTSAGVFRFNVSNREFTAISSNPEIMNVTVKALSIDREGNIWIGAETGLFRFIKSTNTLKRYDAREGLINDSYKAITSDVSDVVYIGGPRGLSVVNLAEMPDTAGIPDVAITSVKYFDNKPDRQDLYYQLPDTIVMPWHRKPVHIEFAVLDLSRPEFNQFRYRFGKTKESPPWQPLGTQNYVILDRLQPGKYRFSVSGSGSDVVWNTAGTSLVIIVESPYWRSPTGLGILLVAGLGLLFLFFRFVVRKFFNLSRENQEREMFAKQIMLQKEELTLKNKAITDSINYAKRIQTAMLPPYKLFKSIFPSSFILFMPKDIVSGDFYWVNKVGNRIFIAAVDCTGHGVPGAFMSIIGFELFRKITNIEGLTRPSDILNRLNDDFHEIFKDVDNVVLRDGMDVAFCSIDKKDMILEFAGAFNPLYLIRDNKIMEVKGDRFAIGLDETNFREQTFKNHIIPIQKDDIIYVFSDGFADQFGGPDGKKYKYRRFRHLLLNLHQLSMEKQHEILENNVMEWRGGQDQVDDILVIGIKIDF